MEARRGKSVKISLCGSDKPRSDLALFADTSDGFWYGDGMQLVSLLSQLG